MDAMPDRASIDSTLEARARHPFRAKFHLRGRDAATVQLRGMEVIREHAAEPLARRVAPAEPAKDGKQTPYRGHPVFVAQHATATCCRTCLQRWHGIPKGRGLTADEQAYAVFDAFPDDAARQAHLSGEVAGSLMEKAPQLLASDPTIERADVLAGKVDVAALQPQPQ
jgi:hypothetical protein